MLRLERVSREFGGVKAVDAVSLEVAPGAIHGLIGPNGAGKTTLVNLISGLLTASAGAVLLDGRSVNALAAHQRARAGLARTFQNLRVFANLSVEQNIDVAARAARAPLTGERAALLDEATRRFDLDDKRGFGAGALSYGHMRRLEIVRALALAPRVLMLDEPAAGMNRRETEDLAAGLQWVRARYACSLLVIDHDLRFIMTLCDRVTVMAMGAVLTTGSPAEVAADPRVSAAYLGDGGHARSGAASIQ